MQKTNYQQVHQNRTKPEALKSLLKPKKRPRATATSVKMSTKNRRLFSELSFPPSLSNKQRKIKGKALKNFPKTVFRFAIKKGLGRNRDSTHANKVLRRGATQKKVLRGHATALRGDTSK